MIRVLKQLHCQSLYRRGIDPARGLDHAQEYGQAAIGDERGASTAFHCPVQKLQDSLLRTVCSHWRMKQRKDWLKDISRSIDAHILSSICQQASPLFDQSSYLGRAQTVNKQVKHPLYLFPMSVVLIWYLDEDTLEPEINELAHVPGWTFGEELVDFGIHYVQGIHLDFECRGSECA